MNFHFAYHSVNLYCPIQIPCGVKHENCIGTWKFGVMRGLKWSQNPLSVEVVHIREQVFTTSNAIEFSSFLPFNLRNVFPFHLSICHPAFIPIKFFFFQFSIYFLFKMLPFCIVKFGTKWSWMEKKLCEGFFLFGPSRKENAT